MRSEAEIDADILDGARKIHNGAVQMGEGYKQLLAALEEYQRFVYHAGGGESLEDLLVHAGPERLRTDVVALLVAAGLGEVLVCAAGRNDQTAGPDFYQRYEGLVNSGRLTKHRGPPSNDHLSGFNHPSVKWVNR